MEFEVLYQRDLKELLEVGLNTVARVITKFGKDQEVVSFSQAFAGEELCINFILGSNVHF